MKLGAYQKLNSGQDVTTINTMPEGTLLAFADHGSVKDSMPFDADSAETMLAAVVRAGVNLEAFAAELEHEGMAAFGKLWRDLRGRIASKSEVLMKARPP